MVDAGFGKGPKALPSGIEFRLVQSAHDDEARLTGRAYLYFWPGGQTERSVVQLKVVSRPDESDALSCVISPLTVWGS